MTLFETLTFDEFDTPFDSLDDLARYILNPENDTAPFPALRDVITLNLRMEPFATLGYSWTITTVAVVRGLPEARALFAAVPAHVNQVCLACRILDRAAFIQRGH